MQKFPYLGFGLGLRPKHYRDIIRSKPAIDWFEIITEDYLIDGGHHLDYLMQIREHYPLVMHGVSLSIGSIDPINPLYLQRLKQLADQIQPQWISDHLCWTGVNGINTHDLLPLPYTDEALKHVVSKIQQVQDYLGQQILLENVSSYISYKDSSMTEWEFLTEACQRADCQILLDVNNIYVSAFNHGFDPIQYLENVPKERVKQFHMAGHHNFGSHIVDTHDANIIDGVWDLYTHAVKHFGRVSTMIERDDHIPELTELYDELTKARQIANKVLGPAS
ncbi:MAG: DUF692 domain-containing protein [Coxiellaceae bacterium]|nr:MAG: DUF692 domain-containing protein [Coxiellaceae bacterium]